MLTADPAIPNGDVRRVESIMGTTVSVAVRAPLVADDVLEAFLDQLRSVDARFSPFRNDSEVSRLARGEIAEADASPDLRHVLSACDHLALVTDAAFDARRHRPAATADRPETRRADES